MGSAPGPIRCQRAEVSAAEQIDWVSFPKLGPIGFTRVATSAYTGHGAEIRQHAVPSRNFQSLMSGVDRRVRSLLRLLNTSGAEPSQPCT